MSMSQNELENIPEPEMSGEEALDYQKALGLSIDLGIAAGIE
jgi:hypothetical protein